MEIRNESVKTPVRMVLEDYDAAPDGVGTYVVLDAKFASVLAALRHRDQMWGGDLYRGYIEDADGKTVETIPTRLEVEREENRAWNDHVCKCDGCPYCKDN